VPAVITPLPPLPASAIDKLEAARRGGAVAAISLGVVIVAVACTPFLLHPMCAVNRLRAPM